MSCQEAAVLLQTAILNFCQRWCTKVVGKKIAVHICGHRQTIVHSPLQLAQSCHASKSFCIEPVMRNNTADQDNTVMDLWYWQHLLCEQSRPSYSCQAGALVVDIVNSFSFEISCSIMAPGVERVLAMVASRRAPDALLRLREPGGQPREDCFSDFRQLGLFAFSKSMRGIVELFYDIGTGGTLITSLGCLRIYVCFVSSNLYLISASLTCLQSSIYTLLSALYIIILILLVLQPRPDYYTLV